MIHLVRVHVQTGTPPGRAGLASFCSSSATCTNAALILQSLSSSPGSVIDESSRSAEQRSRPTEFRGFRRGTRTARQETPEWARTADRGPGGSEVALDPRYHFRGLAVRHNLWPSNLTIEIISSTLYFIDADQTITLGSGATADNWAAAGGLAFGPASSVSSMLIGGNSSAGQSLEIDYVFGDPLPAAGLTFTPTAASGADQCADPGFARQRDLHERVNHTVRCHFRHDHL